MVVDVDTIEMKDKELLFKPGLRTEGGFSEDAGDTLLKPEPKPILKSEKDLDDFECIFTKDPRLLLDYFRIRHEIYSDYLAIDKDISRMEDIDLDSDIVLALKGGRCIGGARVTAKNLLLDEDLPMEEDGFKLVDLFPEYDLKNTPHGEFSRLIFEDGYRSGWYAESIHLALVSRSQAMGLKYIFALTTRFQARRCRQIYKHKFGLNYKTIYDIEVPYKAIYSHMDVCLSVLEL